MTMSGIRPDPRNNLGAFSEVAIYRATYGILKTLIQYLRTANCAGARPIDQVPQSFMQGALRLRMHVKGSPLRVA